MKFYGALGSICLSSVVGALLIYSVVARVICGAIWCSGVGGIAASVLALVGGAVGGALGLGAVLMVARRSGRTG